MQNHHTVFGQNFHPDDIALLQRVIDKAKEDRGLKQDGPRLQELAKDVIDLWEHGVRDESRLHVLVNAIR
jgi:hypothetical protein